MKGRYDIFLRKYHTKLLMSSVKSSAATTFVITIFLICCGMGMYYWREDAFWLAFYDYHHLSAVLGISLVRMYLPIVCYWASCVGGIVDAVAEAVDGIEIVISFRVAIVFSIYLIILGKITHDELFFGTLLGVGSCIASLWMFVALFRRVKKNKKKAVNKIDHCVFIICVGMAGFLFLANTVSLVAVFIQNEDVRCIFWR